MERCDCPDDTELYDHSARCALWDNDGFQTGELMWNGYELVPSGDFLAEGMTIQKLEVDGEERSQEDNDLLHGMYKSLPAGSSKWQDEDFNALEFLGLELHIDPDSHDTVYECLCTKPNEYYCQACGVQRTAGMKKWCPTQRRRDRELEMLQNGYVYACVCDPEELLYICETCEVQRWTLHTPWTYWTDTPTHKHTGTTPAVPGAAWGSTWTPKCRHYGQEVVFPDGTKLLASSSYTRSAKELEDGPVPDFGIYMASSWSPGWLAFLVNWTDYGLPKVPWSDVRHAAEQGLKLARSGATIEVGCVGGHGRTGSMLAIMALMAGVDTAEEAVKWVHEKYCKEAIEGDVQEWYVKYAECQMKGIEAPPQPVPKPTTSNQKNPCTEEEHRNRYQKINAKSCWKAKCDFWETDVKTFVRQKIKAYVAPLSLVKSTPSTPLANGHPKPFHKELWQKGLACPGDNSGKSPCRFWTMDREQFELQLKEQELRGLAVRGDPHSIQFHETLWSCGAECACAWWLSDHELFELDRVHRNQDLPGSDPVGVGSSSDAPAITTP